MILETSADEKRIMRHAHVQFGRVHELDMAIEELSETITQLCHLRRGRATIGDVIDEFGDAVVCVMQAVCNDQSHIANDIDGAFAVKLAIETSFRKLKWKLDHRDRNASRERDEP